MALETKPVPVSRGKAAREFWERVENFKITETREQIREMNHAVRKMIEEQRLRDSKRYD
jgi:TolA-binding protein